MEIVYDDTDDSRGDDQSIIESDFVIVKVPGKKSRIFHYIARVDAFEGDEFEGVLLHQVLSMNDHATFVVDAKDEALYSKSNITIT
ncbi:Hypothetical predicted protein [Octopus vulgaris]|uniref:Uncharacterized protein n=1 Tax=Octopus vulgaris TaxID=6645 RepID=A0AA36API8_OCTVU|nr:Hypothetical predicted protein [Octopus vulgaris]